jgi:hypothetical protein
MHSAIRLPAPSLVALIFPALILIPGALSAQSTGVARAAASITEEDFYNRVEVIAHDSMMGRDTPSPGLDKTARWVGDEFRRFGLKPGGDDGSFLQEYVIQMVAPDLENSVIRVSGGGELAFGRDVIAALGTPAEEEVAGGVVLLAGGALPEGIGEEEMRGRHLILLLPEDTAGQSRRAQMQMLNDIVAAEPVSIMLVNRQSDADWNQAAALQGQRTQPRTPWESGTRAFPTILSVRESSLARLLEARSMEVPSLPKDPDEPATFIQVPGLELTIAARSRVIQELRAPNTVGILEGSDPTLKDEYVVFSGHMDHVGVGRPNEAGDSIYNGADDDASGTVAVVELAEAFAMLDPAPRRSIVFLTVSGEEKGLWGSAYFANYPTVPVESMVADINADMIARNWPDSIVVIGKEHSDLGATLDEVATAHPELNMVPMDDIWPEENFYGRSDHFNFARKGIPILFFFNGTHDDYHRPSDELGKINAEKASRITKLMFYLGLEVANAPRRPQWDPEHYAEIVGGGGS